MLRDEERIERIKRVLSENHFDALVCALPSNVLMLSGYWPVIGSAVAVFTGNGDVIVLAPEDERELAEQGWADETRTFEGGSLQNLKSISESVGDALAGVAGRAGLHDGSVVGYEGSASFEPATYASSFHYGAGMQAVLTRAFPTIALKDATPSLARLRSALTSRELGMVRRACDIAREAFVHTSAEIRVGMRESEVADAFMSKCDGFAYCMSGPNSAKAYAAYQQTGSRAIKEGDFVLVHCNSQHGGFWTDITRTYCIGEPQPTAIRDAILEASQKAMAAVRPGVKACAVDEAARGVLNAAGYGKEFRHATGHGVGFAAINHNALPRIHPLSDEVLEPGMVFNIEPAAYFPDVGGIRHCNMVAVTNEGVELLTDFQNDETGLALG